MKLTPEDASDFGDDYNFSCPECEKKLKIFWFLDSDRSVCTECNTRITPTIEFSSRQFGVLGDIGTTNDGKVHLLDNMKSRCGEYGLSKMDGIPPRGRFCSECTQELDNFEENYDSSLESEIFPFNTEVTPGDLTDFGENKWLDCQSPGCDQNLNLFWFMDGSGECKNCGVEVSIHLEILIK